MQYASQLGIQPSGAPFVAYCNMDLGDLDMEIGFPFEQKPAGKGDVIAGEIPCGRAAIARSAVLPRSVLHRL